MSLSLLIASVSMILSPGCAESDDAACCSEAESACVETCEESSKATPWVLRVGGEAEGELVEREGKDGTLYAAGLVSTETNIPVGYPVPTPPGAIEVKFYPSVRRAEFSNESKAGPTGSFGFFPLFQHISRNNIAMTSPVEMEQADTDNDGVVDQSTMAFLYHTTDDGPTGEDGLVKIVDTEPRVWLSIGVRGQREANDWQPQADKLIDWLDTQSAWVRDGEARVLGYNGPYVPRNEQWWEVQIPVKPGDSPKADAPKSE